MMLVIIPVLCMLFVLMLSLFLLCIISSLSCIVIIGVVAVGVDNAWMLSSSMVLVRLVMMPAVQCCNVTVTDVVVTTDIIVVVGVRNVVVLSGFARLFWTRLLCSYFLCFSCVTTVSLLIILRILYCFQYCCCRLWLCRCRYR